MQDIRTLIPGPIIADVKKARHNHAIKAKAANQEVDPAEIIGWIIVEAKKVRINSHSSIVGGVLVEIGPYGDQTIKGIAHEYKGGALYDKSGEMIHSWNMEHESSPAYLLRWYLPISALGDTSNKEWAEGLIGQELRGARFLSNGFDGEHKLEYVDRCTIINHNGKYLLFQIQDGTTKKLRLNPSNLIFFDQAVPLAVDTPEAYLVGLHPFTYDLARHLFAQDESLRPAQELTWMINNNRVHKLKAIAFDYVGVDPSSVGEKESLVLKAIEQYRDAKPERWSIKDMYDLLRLDDGDCDYEEYENEDEDEDEDDED